LFSPRLPFSSSRAPFHPQRKQTWQGGEEYGEVAGPWSLLSALSCGRNLIFAKSTQMKATPREGKRRCKVCNAELCSVCVCVSGSTWQNAKLRRPHQCKQHTHTHRGTHTGAQSNTCTKPNGNPKKRKK